MYYSNAPEAIWVLFRRSVRSDKVCTANMFTYHSTSLIPHITDIEKNNRNHSFIFWQGTSSQHWQELKSTGVWGVKQVLLVEPWDLGMFELYREEYSTSEGKITTWEPPCMNLERNIVWGGGEILNNLTSQDHLNLFKPKREAQHLKGDDPVYFTSQNNFTSQNHLTSQKHLMISQI